MNDLIINNTSRKMEVLLNVFPNSRIAQYERTICLETKDIVTNKQLKLTRKHLRLELLYIELRNNNMIRYVFKELA